MTPNTDQISYQFGNKTVTVIQSSPLSITLQVSSSPDQTIRVTVSEFGAGFNLSLNDKWMLFYDPRSSPFAPRET